MLLLSLLTLTTASGFAAMMILVWALKDVPWSEIAEDRTSAIVVLEDANGKPIIPNGSYTAAPAEAEDFPRHLVDAVLSIEDRRFHDHLGFDPIGIARAAVENFFAGEIRQGGSTITQQLIKIRYLDDDRTYKRKFQEAAVALWLESRLSKDEILTRYLNNIYMGAGANGMPAAARIYFGKDIRDITLPEAAVLAGIIRAPSRLNPLADRQAAEERAQVVLHAMRDTGTVEAKQAAAAVEGLSEIEYASQERTRGGWFADWADQEARKLSRSLGGTLSVRTTMSPDLQALAEQVISQSLREHAGAGGPTQAALVAMRPNGSVVAMVGGAEYEPGGFNRAVAAHRQPGSTFKLFVYHAALQAGYDPGDIVNDAPIDLDGWAPENFGGDFRGRVTLAEAFARSLNAATVRLAQEVGIENVIRSARELGIDAELQATPSLALGTSEVTLLDLTGAYASVRAGRLAVEPTGIAELRIDGAEDPLRISRGSRTAMSPLVRRSLIGMLRLTVDRGTGRGAALAEGAAGKTGTSQDYRDAWFVGFNGNLIVGVWVGNDNGAPMEQVTGGSVPAKIFQSFMSRAGSRSPTPEAVDRELTTSAIGRDPQPEGMACDIQACERRYRSFRPSDCTYQPYSGPRQLCAAGSPQTLEATGQAIGGRAASLFSTLFPDRIPGPPRCNIAACDRKYRSFRASDCTYRSYSGRRRTCEIQPFPSQQAIAGFPPPDSSAPVSRSSCNIRACERAYRSFRVSDCTYQPYRGPRKLCLR